MEFLHLALWHDHNIDFARWLHPASAMWHVALGSWQWIPQVAVGLPCNVTRSCGIMTLNLPGGSTLQCGRWLWYDIPLHSPKRPPYWTSTSGFNFDHILALDMSFCTSLRYFIQIGPSSVESKNLAIANKSRVSCAHNTSRVSIGLNITPWPWNLA